MFIIGLVIILMFIVMLLLSRNYNKEYFKQLDKNEDPFRFLYPFIFYIHLKTIKVMKPKERTQRKRIFEELYIGKAVEMQNLYFYHKVSLMIVLCFVSLVLAIFVDISAKSESKSIYNNQLTRPAMGQGEESVNIDYATENGFRGNIDIKVSEKQLNSEEVDVLFEEAKRYIDEEILGNNRSTDEVTTNLNLITSIPNTSIIIKWNVSDSTYINRQGVIHNEDLTKDGVLVEIKAEITYYEHQILYSKYIRILPKDYTIEEIFEKELNQALVNLDESTRNENSLKLPDMVNNYFLSWSIEKENSSIYLLFLGVVASFCIMLGMESTLKDKRKLRNLQMLIDYPEIVSKFTLLLNAGMTIRAAFERITLDYLKKRRREESNPKKKKDLGRYAYEELVVAIRELELGKPEAMVYDAYGQRCSLMCYLRFSTIIVQNMKKGTKGIIPMLELEALDAFTERKECAKRLGEEAGTKLLGPMVGMLFIVLLIVLVPAFMNFSF